MLLCIVIGTVPLVGGCLAVWSFAFRLGSVLSSLSKSGPCFLMKLLRLQPLLAACKRQADDALPLSFSLQLPFPFSNEIKPFKLGVFTGQNGAIDSPSPQVARNRADYGDKTGFPGSLLAKPDERCNMGFSPFQGTPTQDVRCLSNAGPPRPCLF